MGEMQIAVLMRKDRLPSSRRAVITDDREVLVGCGGVESAGPAGKARVLQKVEHKVVDGPRARCIYSGKMRPCVHTKLYKNVPLPTISPEQKPYNHLTRMDKKCGIST